MNNLAKQKKYTPKSSYEISFEGIFTKYRPALFSCIFIWGAAGCVIFDVNRKNLKASAPLGTGSVMFKVELSLFRSVDIVDFHWYWLIVYMYILGIWVYICHFYSQYIKLSRKVFKVIAEDWWSWSALYENDSRSILWPIEYPMEQNWINIHWANCQGNYYVNRNSCINDLICILSIFT